MEQLQNPECIGFIMDGNRRWAKAKKKHTLEGHKKGADTFFNVVSYVRDKKIPHAVFYAFSSENWERTEDEVKYLLKLFGEYSDKLLVKFTNHEELDKSVRIRFVGDISRFSPELQAKMKDVEVKSADITSTTIWVALSYGGRAEIVEAVNKAVEKGDKVDEQSFRKLLWSGEMPDPDLIIRTGGQKRLSNFMTWHSVYSELVFLDTLWPDLTAEIIDVTLLDYATRNRNFGK